MKSRTSMILQMVAAFVEWGVHVVMYHGVFYISYTHVYIM